MVLDAAGHNFNPDMHGTSSSYPPPVEQMFTTYTSPLEEAEVPGVNETYTKFQEVLSAADEPLWAGCNTHTKLSLTAKLLNVKVEYNYKLHLIVFSGVRGFTFFLANMNLFRRGGRRRGAHHTPPTDTVSTPPPNQADTAGPSHTPSTIPSCAPSPSPSPSPSAVPSPIESPATSSIPSRHSIAERPDTRESIAPCGDSFDNSVHVIHEINRIVNNHWRGDSMSYTSTPAPTRELWWSEFKRSFTWDMNDDMEIRRIFMKKCGDHIRHVLNHAKSKGKKPPFITEENWIKITNYWESEEFKTRSHQNKTNQSFNSGDMSATYAGGSINIDEHRRRLSKELGKEPTFIETFTRTFQKKDKTWSGDRARAIKEKYDELEVAQRCSGSTSADMEGSESSVGTDLNLWLQASGGSKKGGKIFGMGSLSRIHRVGRISSSSSQTQQMTHLTEEVSQLKDILNERDEEMRQMRQNQELILRHFKLISAPSENPPGDGDDGDHDDGDGGES
ncbi:uncharacterized protein LOC122025119 [Zingiber officinale]|uniref:uncharacterized protein LOC122025119 n=1 Tax=Zingiber officinale TaxID=94328 RepID=UPI001C4A847D|nr:uncharacterized protein LOC122025119 [Zingiber officinale]